VSIAANDSIVSQLVSTSMSATTELLTGEFAFAKLVRAVFHMPFFTGQYTARAAAMHLYVPTFSLFRIEG
jgi:hypothetical protein